MISARGSALALLLAFLVFLFLENGPTRLPLLIHGDIDPRYERVKQAFTQNFLDGWERGGASLAVYKDGEKVVDLWGGYADRSSLRPWKQDTLQVVFSTTKGVAALCVAMLVDRGLLSYSDLVAEHWPEFAQNGKGNVTVQMVLSHEAGLAYLDKDVSFEQAADHEYIAKLIEQQKPHWPPGTMTAYHIYTYGWLVDQLIRRVDPAKRGIGQFVREELHEPYKIDFHVGLPREEAGRVARLTPPSVVDRLSELRTDYRVSKYFFALYHLLTESMLSRALNNLGWLECVHQMTVNNPDYWSLEQAAALGIGNARSLAQIFDLAVRAKLFSPATLQLLQKPHTRKKDGLMGDPLAKGNGLFYMKIGRAGTENTIGHTGHGCQQVIMDVGNGLSVGYTSNGMKTGLANLCRTWRRLESAIYDVLEEK